MSDDYKKDFESKIPSLTLDALKRYIEERIPTGGFLQAVLENNLSEALGRADVHNRAAIFEITGWIYNYAPSACHGSPEKVREWLEKR